MGDLGACFFFLPHVLLRDCMKHGGENLAIFPISARLDFNKQLFLKRFFHPTEASGKSHRRGPQQALMFDGIFRGYVNVLK